MTGRNVFTVKFIGFLFLFFSIVLYIGNIFYGDPFVYTQIQKYLPEQSSPEYRVVPAGVGVPVVLNGNGVQVVPAGPVVHNGEECYKTFLEKSKEKDLPVGSIPWLDDATVQLFCTLLHKDLSVLEWGCGGSTVYFSRFVKKWRCIEHVPSWGEKVKEYLQNESHRDKVTVKVIEPSKPYNAKVPAGSNNDGTYEQFSEYIEYPGSLGEKFGLIMDDGRARVAAALSVIRNDLLEDNGFVLIHDWERRSYHKVLSQGFKIWKEEKTSARHLVALQVAK